MSIRLLTAACIAAAALVAGLPVRAADAVPFRIDVYNPGAKSVFPVSASIVEGRRDALLIDAQFQRNDAEALVDRLKASGKRLTTIYISHQDPDFYFGLDTVMAAFPDAKVVATPQTVAGIRAHQDAKLAYWGPVLKDNAPRALIVPAPLAGDTLTLEGRKLKIVGLRGPSAARTVLWIPTLRAVVGGVPIAANLHVWMADTPTPQARRAWLRQLARIAALRPTLVVPGHFLPNPDGSEPHTLAAVTFTRDYVRAFDQEAARTRNAAELIEAMRRRYPNLGDVDALELSAKVVKGEMKWPAE
jgi:glyoxylase-like metal-dependent hydrolase (beta-lactamase superfamily II)